MTTTFVRGDLFDYADDHIIGHGVNCIGKMGAGIAWQFAQKYPDMYLAYDKICRRNALDLGMVFPWVEEGAGECDQIHILNMATQRETGHCADLDALYRCMEFAALYSIGVRKPLALPMVGAGIGGLNPDDVIDTMMIFGDHVDITVVEYADGVRRPPRVVHRWMSEAIQHGMNANRGSIVIGSDAQTRALDARIDAELDDEPRLRTDGTDGSWLGD